MHADTSAISVVGSVYIQLQPALDRTQRRIIAWNVIVAVSLFWLSLPYAARHMRIFAVPYRDTAVVGVVVFLVIWALLAVILVQAAMLLLT